MAGTGFASYDDALDPKHGAPHDVPLIIATDESFKDFGRLVHSFDDEEVWITKWPQEGWRPICPGTGDQGGVAAGEFEFHWEGDLLCGLNKSVTVDPYTVGRLPRGVSPANRTHVLAREANYHPDGGQVFFPKNGEAFVMMLALPGDNVKLEDFVAFYVDGSFGVQIKAYVWHQPAFPIPDRTVLLGKQGKVHACAKVDTVEEFGVYLKVPLKPELATST